MVAPNLRPRANVFVLQLIELINYLVLDFNKRISLFLEKDIALGLVSLITEFLKLRKVSMSTI